MDDDFFELPDEGTVASSSNNLLNSSLFGDSKRPVAAKSIDDILASLPNKAESTSVRGTTAAATTKRPGVTFQEPLPSAAANNSQLSPRQFAAAASPLNPPPPPLLSANPINESKTNDLKLSTSLQPSVTSATSNPGPKTMQSSLLDSLFPSASTSSSSKPAVSESVGGLFSGARPRRNKPLEQNEESPRQKPQAEHSRINPPNNTSDSLIASKEREAEELRRELSNLRYEKAESQRNNDELRRKLEDALRDHQQTLERLNEQHNTYNLNLRKEIYELQKRHNREVERLNEESENKDEILSNIKQQKSHFTNLEDGVSRLSETLANIREKVGTIGSREADVHDVLDFAKTQIERDAHAFEAQKLEWARQRENTLAKTQDELSRLAQNYEREIIEGRRWLEEEREKIRIERVAFQTEQVAILDVVERKKDELDAQKSEFLSREHDLLIRVVNEKVVLEQQRRDFEHQRNADVARLRHEAQHLEQCLIQVENAKNTLRKAKHDYDVKQQQLNDVKAMLVEYEKRRLQNNK